MLDEKSQITLQEIIRHMFPGAEREAARLKKRPSTVATSYLRAQVRDVFRRMGDHPQSAGVMADGRARPFEYHLQLWDVAAGEDRGELMAESERETVKGLRAVCAAIADHIATYHEDESLREGVEADALRRLPTFRTSISRAGGEAMMRLRYDAAGVPHLAAARVAREKLSETEA